MQNMALSHVIRQQVKLSGEDGQDEIRREAYVQRLTQGIREISAGQWMTVSIQWTESL